MSTNASLEAAVAIKPNAAARIKQLQRQNEIAMRSVIRTANREGRPYSPMGLNTAMWNALERLKTKGEVRWVAGEKEAVNVAGYALKGARFMKRLGQVVI